MFLIKDRLLRGALAGVLGGLVLLTWNLFSNYILHFAKKTWLEALNQLIMGHSLKEAMDYVVAFGLLCIWNAFLGAIYVRLVIPDREGSYLGRAIGFGLISWFIFYALGTMFKIQGLHEVAWQTALSNWIAIAFFGIVLGCLKLRQEKVGVGTNFSSFFISCFFIWI